MSWFTLGCEFYAPEDPPYAGDCCASVSLGRYATVEGELPHTEAKNIGPARNQVRGAGSTSTRETTKAAESAVQTANTEGAMTPRNPAYVLLTVAAIAASLSGANITIPPRSNRIHFCCCHVRSCLFVLSLEIPMISLS